MKKILFVCCALMALNLNAQDFAKNKDAIKFAKSITTKNLRTHLSILASDEYEGRETGKKGQKMAAKYIAKQFESLNLQAPVDGSFFQTFTLTQSKLTNIYFKKGEEKKIGFEDFIYYSKSETKGEELINLIVWSDSIQDIKYENSYLVFFVESMLELQGIVTKSENLNASGMIVIVTNQEAFATVLDRYGRYLKGPSLGLGKRDEAADKLIIGDKALVSWFFDKKFEEITPGDKNSLVLNADYFDKPLSTENVLGVLPGTEKPEEVLVVTAHYDHIGITDGEINNGADDDGSGTVTVLEIAEAFVLASKKKKGPKRTILFMTVTGEEKGLLGSEYYADFDPIFPLDATVANLNIDMVGRVDDKHKDTPDYIYLIGSDKLSQDLHQLSENINSAYTNLELDYTYNDENDPNRFYYRSDHYNFAKNNIPIIFYFNGTHPDYHKPTDTIEKINFDKMVKVAKLIFHTAWEIANRDERIILDN